MLLLSRAMPLAASFATTVAMPDLAQQTNDEPAAALDEILVTGARAIGSGACSAIGLPRAPQSAQVLEIDDISFSDSLFARLIATRDREPPGDPRAVRLVVTYPLGSFR